LKILIDADACPVTNIVIKIARQRGMYSELMKAKGFYYNLYSVQFAMAEQEET
jgi:uncharacterized protein YaiI (UPF0178 family)